MPLYVRGRGVMPEKCRGVARKTGAPPDILAPAVLSPRRHCCPPAARHFLRRHRWRAIDAALLLIMHHMPAITLFD